MAQKARREATPCEIDLAYALTSIAAKIITLH